MGLDEAVDGDSTLAACGDSINGELGAGVHITAHEDVGLVGLIGEAVGHSAVAATQCHLGACQQVAPLDALTDGEEHVLTLHRHGVVLVIGGAEATLSIPNAYAALKDDAAYLSVLGKDLLGTPTAVDGNALFRGLADLLFRGGHTVTGLEAVHIDAVCAAAVCAASHIDGYVTAAYHNGAACHLIALVCAHGTEEVHSGHDALSRFAVHACKASALTADGDVEGLVALVAELLNGDVLANFHAAFDLHAHGADHVDLSVDDILLQLEAGDTVAEHTAGTLVLLEDHGAVALLGEIEGAAEARGACADDGHLLGEETVEGGDNLLGDKAGLGLEILLGDELLHLIDGDGLIDAAAGAGILTAAVADATADGGQGVILLNECQRLGVATLCRHLQIALHGDVSGAGGLTGSSTGVVAVDAVVVAVVLIPHMGAPLLLGGQGVTGILHLAAVLGAELLTQFHSTCGADLHALAAGHAVALLHAGNIGAAGEVGGVEQLRGTQGVAHVNIAVTDGEDLILAVDVGDLMDEAVLLALTEDVQRLFAGDVAAALACLHHVIRHVAHGDAPTLGVVGAAFIEGEAGLTAGAGGGGVLAVILIQPVGDVLKVNGGILRLDGLLHGDDMHTDARAAGRHHGGDLLQGQAGHTLEEAAHLGVLLQDSVVHVGELGAAGDEHG